MSLHWPCSFSNESEHFFSVFPEYKTKVIALITLMMMMLSQDSEKLNNLSQVCSSSGAELNLDPSIYNSKICCNHYPSMQPKYAIRSVLPLTDLGLWLIYHMLLVAS